MATSFDSFGSSSLPMAWSSQPTGTAWPGQQATAAFEPERGNTSTHLLAQLGLVPSQAMPVRGPHNGSMPAQTLLSTTVAPQRSQPQHNSEQMGLGHIESQSPFLFTPPSQSQRYQAFSPGSDFQAGEELTGMAPGSSLKQFRFNPHAMPFVFSSTSTGADKYSDLAETESTCANLSRAGVSSEEGEELGAGEAAAVSTAVASAVIFSPLQGPDPMPSAVPFSADALPNRTSPLLVSPANSTDSAKKSWNGEQAGVAETYTWLPASAVAPLRSSQDQESQRRADDDYAGLNHDTYLDASPLAHSEAMCPMLMQLRGTAHSVALGALDLDLSPDAGPSFSPRAPGLTSISV